MYLSELKKDQKAVIVSIENKETMGKLMEMGCLPGESVEMENTAPLGDPIAIKVAGYKLSLRKIDAANIMVQLLD